MDLRVVGVCWFVCLFFQVHWLMNFYFLSLAALDALETEQLILMSLRLMQMSLAEPAIQLRREDFLPSPPSSPLAGCSIASTTVAEFVLITSHYLGEMLIKQPGSYRKFCLALWV